MQNGDRELPRVRAGALHPCNCNCRCDHPLISPAMPISLANPDAYLFAKEHLAGGDTPATVARLLTSPNGLHLGVGFAARVLTAPIGLYLSASGAARALYVGADASTDQVVEALLDGAALPFEAVIWALYAADGLAMPVEEIVKNDVLIARQGGRKSLSANFIVAILAQAAGLDLSDADTTARILAHDVTYRPIAAKPMPKPKRIKTTWEGAREKTLERIPVVGAMFLWLGATFTAVLVAGVVLSVAVSLVVEIVLVIIHLLVPTATFHVLASHGAHFHTWRRIGEVFGFLIALAGPLAAAVGIDMLIMHGRAHPVWQWASRTGLWAATGWSLFFIIDTLVRLHH